MTFWELPFYFLSLPPTPPPPPVARSYPFRFFPILLVSRFSVIKRCIGIPGLFITIRRANLDMYCRHCHLFSDITSPLRSDKFNRVIFSDGDGSRFFFLQVLAIYVPAFVKFVFIRFSNSLLTDSTLCMYNETPDLKSYALNGG